MYAIKRKDNGKILGVGNRWMKPNESPLLIWYERELAEHYMKHSVPNRIKSEIISINL